MKLGDKAEESPDVDLARQSAPGVYRLKTDNLVPADVLTAEGQFPQYGDFLHVETTNGGSEPTWDGEQFIECPQDLAKWLVEEVEIGDGFRIKQVTKIDGEWEYSCELVDEVEEAE